MKRLTLYQRLKPEVKRNIQKRESEFKHTVDKIYTFLKESDEYNELTINEVNLLILFSSVRPEDAHDFANGGFAFYKN